MSVYFQVVRSDGAVLAGPYLVTGLASVSLVDLAPAGTWSYHLNIWSDSGTDGLGEARVAAIVAKR